MMTVSHSRKRRLLTDRRPSGRMAAMKSRMIYIYIYIHTYTYLYIYIYIYVYMADSPHQRQLKTQKWTNCACELNKAYPINRTRIGVT